MNLTIQADPVPLTPDAYGGFRIGRTRVTLDVFIAAYEAGASPEQIAENFDTLDLADIHSVIAYYLRHTEEVREYLRQRSEEADQIQREIESRFDPTGLRRKLLERRSQSQKQS